MNYFNPSELKKRGWNNGSIRMILREPDMRIKRDDRIGIPLYSICRVKEQEVAHPEFCLDIKNIRVIYRRENKQKRDDARNVPSLAGDHNKITP
jgi:hypothetical protein